MRWIVLALALVACGETGQDLVTFPLHGAGTGERSFESGGFTITLERADVGFGPVYFCAARSADDDLCARANAEWLGTGTVDALDATPVLLGEAGAITSTVRSATFDYGRSWPLAATVSRANEGAPEGRSALLVARAVRGDEAIEVRASIDLDPADAGLSAVIGAPTGEHAIRGDEALVVRMDPAAWWRRVDFEAVRDLDSGDGVVELAPGDAAYEALVLAMTSSRVPSFEWEQP